MFGISHTGLIGSTKLIVLSFKIIRVCLLHFVKHFLWMLSKLFVFSKVNCKSSDLYLHSLGRDISHGT